MLAVPPREIVCVGVVTLSVKSSPVPLSAMLCGLSAALSVNVTAATRAPPAVGLNVTVIVQFALAARDEPQVLVSMKSPGFVPPGAMLVIARAVPPLFVTVTICDALDTPETVAANVSVFAESIAVGCTWPVPINAMECGFPGASSLITIEADLAPAAAGVNFTLKVQTALTAIEATQSFVCVKSFAFAPVIEIPSMLRTAVPVFVSVIICAALCVPTPCAVNVTLVVENVATGAAVPVPLSVADCGLPGASSATSTEAERS